MKKAIVVLMVLLTACFAAAATWSDVAAKDTMADGQWPNDNLGGWTGLQVGSGWPQGTDRFGAWLSWNLPVDLAGATVTSATLTMKQTVDGAGGSFPTLGIRVNLMSHDWTEMGLTVYKYDGVNSWTDGYYMGYGDRVADGGGVPIIYDTQTVTIGNYSDVVFSMASAVQYWADGGTNYGLFLDADNSGYDTYVQFCSSEVAGSEPVLSLTYEPIPEPLTLILLGIGGLAAVRSKK